MAVGDRVESRVFGPSAVGTTDTTLGTVPSSRVWVVKQFIVTNTNGVDAWVTISIGATSTASNAIMYQLPISANDTLVFDTALVLTAAETVQAISDRGAVNVTAMGWVKETA
jgi:hypothetical protein